MARLDGTEIADALKNLQNVQIILETTDTHMKVPQQWWQLVTLDEGLINFEALNKLWQPAVKKLPYIYEELERRLLGLAILVEEDKLPSLLYIFRYKSGKLAFKRGFPPIDVNNLNELERSYYKQLPDYFTQFYRVHNGWYSLFSKAGGPKPSFEWEVLDRCTYKISPEEVANMPFAPEDVLITYSNGGSEYMGFLINHAESKPVWWSNKYKSQPDTSLNYWEELDAIESEMFEEYQLRGGTT